MGGPGSGRKKGSGGKSPKVSSSKKKKPRLTPKEAREYQIARMVNMGSGKR
jgi:hypothetical protein